MNSQQRVHPVSGLWISLIVFALVMAGIAPVLAAHVALAPGAVDAVTLDGAVSSGTADGVSTITISHTTGTGVNRLMLVGVSSNSYNGARTISSVTFTPSGGTAAALTEVGHVENEAGRLAAIYYLLAPPSGQAGTVTVTYSGSVAYGIVAGVANFAGVDQTTPLGAFTSNVGTEAAAISVSVATDPDDLVFDTVFLGAATLPSLTAGSGQTQHWNANIDRARGVASTKLATTTTTEMSWTPSGGATAYYWAIAAVPINPAATGPTQQLTVAVDPAGGGTTSPSAGVHIYAQGATVNVTATPAEHYEFDRWDGACTGTDPDVCPVTMDVDKTVTAFFTEIPEYTLTVNTSGPGSVTLDPPGGTYYRDTVVTLTPVPGDCATFSSWSGTNQGDIQGSGPYTILMNGNKSVQANFTTLPQFTLDAGDDGNGSVTLDPAGGTYCTGTTVTLTPVPDSGYVFDSWSGTNAGNIVDTGGIYTILMNADKAVTANFAVSLWPTVDGAASTGTGAPTASSVSFSHTAGTGASRLMLVGVSWNCGNTDRTITSVTFTPGGGSATALAEVRTQQYYWTGSPSTDNYRYTAIYSLLNPPSGAAGTIDIVFSGAVSNGIIAGAANFAGVNQANPLGTPAGAVGTGTSSSGTPNPAVTLTGLNGNELVFDSVFIGVSNANHAITADAGQSELWNSTGYPTSNFNTLGAASTKGATGASATMSWTTAGYGTTATRWAIVAVPINPADGGVTRLLGDVDRDGDADSTDALIVLTADAGLPAPGYCPMNYGDVDGNGLVNSTDALIILTYDAGLSVLFPLEQPVAEPVLTKQPDGCLLGQ